MSMYIPLLLLSPFLATGASALEKRDYQRLLLVLFILNFVLNGIGYGALFLGPIPLPFYIFVFLIGGYLRLYGCQTRYSQYGIYIYLFGYLALAIVQTIIQLHFAPTGIFPHIKGMANNKIALFMSVLLFGRGVSRPQKDICIGLWNVSISPYILAVYIIRNNLQILLLL